MDLSNIKFLVIGAGFYGSVIAERIAADLQEKVIIIDKRSHVGGNSYSTIDSQTGIEVHKYGSHIFHTDNKGVWEYINRFTTFNNYRHKVLTTYKNKVFSMPINLHTINNFYNKNLRPFEVDGFLKSEIDKENIDQPQNLEEKAISLIGRPLYEAFIKNYTFRHWGIDPKKLPKEIITRLPVRNLYNADYFDGPWQGIPTAGYGKLFQKILEHPNIDLHLNVDYFDIEDQVAQDTYIIYSGPLDQFFQYKYGNLSWRVLEFDKEVLPYCDYQGTAVMNYADVEGIYTRTHEFKHYHPERNYDKIGETVLFHEKTRSSKPDDVLYYPINTVDDQNKLEQYQKEAKKLSKVIFGGRLGSYKYYDMHHVIKEALEIYNKKIKKEFIKT